MVVSEVGCCWQFWRADEKFRKQLLTAGGSDGMMKRFFVLSKLAHQLQLDPTTQAPKQKQDDDNIKTLHQRTLPKDDSYCHIPMRFLAAVVLIAAHFGNCVQSFVPSMMLHQRQSSLYFSRGDEFGPVVFDINSPDEFKDFVAVDDRPAVIKVYADWCKTCRLFDIRYRKVASSWGCDPYSAKETEFSNLVRFAQMEYGGEKCNNCREDLRH